MKCISPIHHLALINEAIEAASTKWNFMKLTPGMVGGHCISIDPYYLMHKSEISGYTPYNELQENLMMKCIYGL